MRTLLVTLICLCGLAAASFLWSLREEPNRLERRLRGARGFDGSRFEHVVFVMNMEILDSTGLLIQSLDHLQQTAYYPYRQPYGKASGEFLLERYQGKLELRTTRKENGQVVWTGVVHEGRSAFNVASFSFRPPSSEELTRRKLAFYSSGLSKQIEVIRKLRLFFSHEDAICLRSIHADDYFSTRPMTRRPFDHDIPQNPQQLEAYVNWLAELEHAEYPTDGWGRPVIFVMKTRMLVLISVGSDGIRGNQDDMSVPAPLFDAR